MSEKPTGKQLLFAQHYIVTLNQTESARLAGYKGDDVTLASTGSRLIRNHKVLAYINAQLEQYAMAASEVITRLTDIARGDIADTLNPLGGIDPLEAKRRGKSHLIKRIKSKTTLIAGKGDDDGMEIHETEIEMHDSLKALDLLAKYYDLTNRIKIDDWRKDIIMLLRAGKVTPEQVTQELGVSIAQELFASIGLQVDVGSESAET